MRKGNDDLLAQMFNITGNWIWYLVKFCLAIVFLVLKVLEWLIHAINALLFTIIKTQE